MLRDAKGASTLTEQRLPDTIAALDELGIKVNLDGALSIDPRFAAIGGTGEPTGLKRAARRGLARLALTPLGRRLLGALLRDDQTRAWMLTSLSDSISFSASFEEADSLGPEAVWSFEGCAWLFSSNMLNHRLARLEIEEAAYLFRLVKTLGEPRVAEIGRYKGGSTFLLAAAGGRVLSIDNDLGGQLIDAPALGRALERAGLRERVEIVVADSRAYPLDPASLDFVFLDGDHLYEGVRADFEHWWPALVDGGHLVFHDAERESWTPSPAPVRQTEGVIRLVHEISSRDDIAPVRGAPGTLAHFVKAVPSR